MDEFLYNALVTYYDALGKIGYMADCVAHKLLILSFYRDFMLKDYRGLLSKGDYHLIEIALDGVYGKDCLIPYPDYLKMGKLHLGEMTEMAQRVKTLENTSVLKAMDADGTLDSDIVIVAEEETA